MTESKIYWKPKCFFYSSATPLINFNGKWAGDSIYPPSFNHLPGTEGGTRAWEEGGGNRRLGWGAREEGRGGGREEDEGEEEGCRKPPSVLAEKRACSLNLVCKVSSFIS